MASASTTDPQSFNRYSYVRNRPLGSIDPNGMDDCEIGKTCSFASDDWATNGNHPEQGQIRATVDVDVSNPIEAPSIESGATLEMRPIEPEVASAPKDWDPSCGACASFLPEMHKRAVPIKQMVEVGAVIATAEIAAPVLLIEAAGAGTATLGIEAASLDTAVIGSQANTAVYVGQTGFNVLRVPASYGWQTANIPWLNNIISSGQSVIVLSGSIYTQQEVQHLQSVGGYIWNAGGDKLIPH